MDRITIDFTHSKGSINRNIYGHFAEHIGGVMYDGLWVGEDSNVENIRGFRKALVDSFRKIHPPVLRWPGGCFAETYDWRDGIGPRENRPIRVNWWYSHDKRTESNQVGTHEFMDLCELLNTQPYFAANMTSVTPLHIRNWIEYCNFPEGSTTFAKEREQNGSPEPFNVRLWGIGNENWGGGGQMTPEDCAREFIRFSTVSNSLDKGNLKFIICGANRHDVQWTRRLMQEYTSHKHHEAEAYGVSIHYYCGNAGDPVAFTEDEWYQQLFQADYMRNVLDDHRAAIDEFDPERKLGLIVDEWGCWHKDGSGPSRGCNLFEQQSTMRDAVVAAMTLNIFNNRCDSVAMANIAQLCNNLHSLYLAGGDHCVETPNYFVFDMFKTHQDARQLHTIVSTAMKERDDFRPMELISASASLNEDMLTLTLANLHMTESKTVSLEAIGATLAGRGTVTVLAHTDPHTCNTFEEPRAIQPKAYETHWGDEKPSITLPAAGIVSLVIKLEPQPGDLR